MNKKTSFWRAVILALACALITQASGLDWWHKVMLFLGLSLCMNVVLWAIDDLREP